MFAIVAEKYQYVVGVDTHARKHVATIVDNHGVTLSTREVRVTGPQMSGFVTWIRKSTDNADKVLLAVEGTSSYGETLTKLALANGFAVVEVKPPKTRGGRPRADDRKVLDGILFSLKSGCRWDDIPAEHFAPGVTCWRRLRQWEEDGTWERIWKTLLATLDREDKLDYAAAFLDGSFAPAKKGA